MKPRTLPWLNTSVRKKADDADKKKARASAGEYRTVSNSGAGRHKLDIVGQADAVETKHTDKASYSLRSKDLSKLFRDVARTGGREKARWPVMEITMQDENDKPLTVIVMQPEFYEFLKGHL
jgi:hypothetical protein